MQPDSPYKTPATFESTLPPVWGTDAPLTVKQILFSFHGRIPRRTFWLYGVLVLIGLILPIGLVIPLLDHKGIPQGIGIVLLIALGVLFVWINLAVKVKRWHDHDKPGVWILIGMIPYAGALISLIFLGCLRGTQGPNRYGNDPT